VATRQADKKNVIAEIARTKNTDNNIIEFF
jgi:hypothetical protein